MLKGISILAVNVFLFMFRWKTREVVSLLHHSLLPVLLFVPAAEDSSDDDEPLIKMVKKAPTEEQLKETVKSLLKEANLEEMTMKQICQRVTSLLLFTPAGPTLTLNTLSGVVGYPEINKVVRIY